MLTKSHAAQSFEASPANLSIVKGLYAICDLDFLAKQSLDPVQYAKALIEARPAALQLRAKSASAQRALGLLRQLLPMCRAAGVPLFANDRPDLAVLAGADGVHVGQDDVAVADVRRFDANLMVGLSTHSLPQLETALADRPSYLAFGPLFATSSKQDPENVVGLPLLREAQQLAGRAAIPLVAIGGIARQHLDELVGQVDCVAVISGLCPTSHSAPDGAKFFEEVTAIARTFQLALAGG